MNPVNFFNSLKKLLRKKRFLFLLSIVLIYKSIFNVFTGEYALKKGFQSISKGKIELSLTRFSLFFGIEARKVAILSGDDFDKKPFFQADRVAVLYNLPALFTGRLKISEIALIKPEIYLYEKQGKWNFETLFPPGKKKEPEPEKESTPLTEINTYIPVSAYLKLDIKDLKFHLEKETHPLFLELDRFSFFTELDTKRFRKIQFTPGAFAEIPEILELSINQNNKLFVNFRDTNKEIKEEINLLLLFKFKKEEKEIYSKVDIGSDALKPVFLGKEMKPFLLKLFYELKYEPAKDLLSLNDFFLHLDKNEWLKIQGTIANTFKDTREFNLEVIGSSIDLLKASEIYGNIPGLPVMKMAGNLELFPINAAGQMNNLKLSADLRGKNIKIQTPGKTFSIPSFQIKITSLLDLLADGEKTKETPFPQIQELDLKTSLQYSTAFADLTASIVKNKFIAADLKLKSLNLAEFINTPGGIIGGNLSLTGENFSRLNIAGAVSGSYFDFIIGRNKSEKTHLDLKASVSLFFLDGFKISSIHANSLSLLIKDKYFKDTGILTVQGAVSLGEELKVNLTKVNLDIFFTRLFPILPISLKESLLPAKKFIGETLGLQGKLDLTNNSSKLSINSKLLLALSGLNINDIAGDFAVNINKTPNKNIELNRVNITALQNRLKADINGQLKEGKQGEKSALGSFNPDLKIKLLLDSNEFKELTYGINYEGRTEVALEMKDSLIKGNINANNVSAGQIEGECPGKNCKFVILKNLFLNLPIEHNLFYKETDSFIEGDKTKYIKSLSKSSDSNLKIQTLLASHPSLEGETLTVFKETDGQPGLSGKLEYRENTLFIDSIRAYTFNGIITGKDILFKVGSGKPENMEYRAALQIKDIDLRELLPNASRQKIKDGKIKADINLSGTNLKDPVGNLNLYFSVYKIGTDFGKSAINIISPPNLITDIVSWNYSIEKIDIELSSGLVYANILFKRSIMSTLLIGIENNKISQERMPLANFLKRAESEISTYN